MSGEEGPPQSSLDGVIDTKQASGGGASSLSSRAGPSLDERGTDKDAFALLGGNQDGVRFSMRALAVSNPKEYERQRVEAMNNISKSVNGSYKDAYGAYKSAGYAKESSEQMAMEAAKSQKLVMMDIFSKKFDAGSDGVYGVSNQRQGGMLAAAPKSAPAKRKPTKKRK
jgi:hypothetical protein